MAFHDREYQVYVALGHPTASPPWVEKTWSPIFEALDPIIHKARNIAAVRSQQLGSGLGSPNQRGISFGRLGWNAHSCKKWTHSEDGVLLSGNHAVFLSCEVWAPSWSICTREGLAPDVYFAMGGESDGNAGKSNNELKFNSHCILAVASDIEQMDASRQCADSIASALGAVLQAYRVRPWGVQFGKGFYSNAINDLVVTGLFNPGPRHKAGVTLSSLAGPWDLL
jgi:hypothetical protein